MRTIEEINKHKEGQEKIDKVIDELNVQGGFYSSRYEITFNKIVNIPVNRRKRKDVKKIEVKLFIATNLNLCYTFYKRTGFRFLTYIKPEDIEDIKKIDIEEKRIEEGNKRPHKAELLRDKIYPNLWPELKEKTGEYLAENDFRESDLKPVYFLNKFSRYNRERIYNDIKTAFDQKKDYNYRQNTNYHTGRDFSIEVKVKEDGTIRAWFSSEYKDCANGDYYLILNPKIAVFYEKD